MSYCVRCGVELADYEKECPLCHTKVIDPLRESKHEPMNLDRLAEAQGSRLNKKFIIFLCFGLLLIPFIVTALISLFSPTVDMTWSFYVLGAELCFFSIVLVPFLYPGKKVYVYVLADILAVALLLLLIAVLTDGLKWFREIALPVTVLTGIVVLILSFIIRRRYMGRAVKLGWSILAVALLPSFIDILIAHYRTKSFLPVWSWYATIPLIALGATVLILGGNARFKEWIRRKIFI